MKIRTKMISLLALLFAVLIVAEVAVQKLILMPSFAQLERDNAEVSMRRIRYALDSTLDALQLTAADWGNWADVYRFVRVPTADFVSANLTPNAMKQLQVNAMLIVDLDGRLVAADTYDLLSSGPLDLDLAAGPALPADFPWRTNLAGGKPAKGLFKTNLGIMLLAAAPVLDGSGVGAPLGMVIVGKLLTPAVVMQLGAEAQADLSLTPGDAGPIGTQIVEAGSATRVYRSFADVYGRPLLRLRVDVPREITARGQEAVTYASLYLVGAAVLGLILVVVVLNRVVLTPLARVTRHAVALGEGSDLTARLNLPGGDEITLLAREFDHMVGRVADSSRQLVDQSFQSGFAELAKGVLHNLGNAMTPLGVRLSKLGTRLRDAPVSDVELALTELGVLDELGDAARRADLEEFIRLGCRELVTLVKEARADTAVIQRQTAIVQTSLNELMRSTHNDQVVEAVRLPDLVAQTLEIVPDACRQRLFVDADDSLRSVGVVQVARTVLRLVLQNLIINAADAVRDAGRARGVLHVAAEIVSSAGCDQLHLQCRDNGVGIAHDKLERVFDKGFSTKSNKTNHGIGLHWCATAIGALGGRIWASSEGPGRGASMHLMLPLTAQHVRMTP